MAEIDYNIVEKGKLQLIIRGRLSSETTAKLWKKTVNKVAKVIEQGSDENTGKGISSSKAKIIAAATPENDALITTKINIENIEQMINSLKNLQKGVLNEYSHMGNT